MAPFFMLQGFENYLAAEKRSSKHTVVAYLKDVQQFMSFLKEIHHEDITALSNKEIRRWIVVLMDQGISSRTISRKLSSLRTYFQYCIKMKWVKLNPLAKITAPKQHKRLPVFAKESEMHVHSIDSTVLESHEDLRDFLMIELFYQTGIRLSELIELKKQDVKIESIRVFGKRNKERVIPISEDLHFLLQIYIKLVEKQFPTSKPLFVLKNGNKLYPKFVYRKINTYLGSVTNLEKRSPHVLRHTFATHMLNRGAGLEVLKDLLGHANLSATQVYTHNSFAQLTNIYSLAHPRGTKSV